MGFMVAEARWHFGVHAYTWHMLTTIHDQPDVRLSSDRLSCSVCHRGDSFPFVTYINVDCRLSNNSSESTRNTESYVKGTTYRWLVDYNNERIKKILK